MAVVDLETEVAKAGNYPRRFNKRSAKLLESVQDYMGFRIVKAGIHQTSPDSSSPHTNDITASGVLASDIVIAQLQNAGPTVNILRATAAANTITIEFSGDPSNTHYVQYIVLRAV